MYIGDTYALSATYGGVEDKLYEVVFVVYSDKKKLSKSDGWDLNSEAKGRSIERLKKNNFPLEMIQLAEGCTRFFQVRYRCVNTYICKCTSYVLCF